MVAAQLLVAVKQTSSFSFVSDLAYLCNGWCDWLSVITLMKCFFVNWSGEPDSCLSCLWPLCTITLCLFLCASFFIVSCRQCSVPCCCPLPAALPLLLIFIQLDSFPRCSGFDWVSKNCPIGNCWNRLSLHSCHSTNREHWEMLIVYCVKSYLWLLLVSYLCLNSAIYWFCACAT